ncbi:D-alanyl-D-alanine carboxypeptidase/D-alanyl-D-alanine-endopeptidase [Candidatus Poribacteria bacterium]|nr:MAG: D-alanyl-D-alanine carboxypeptidase/D-alanyl-D-alanine-endopeptidase [Candidatus Poribacteria bacterium]
MNSLTFLPIFLIFLLTSCGIFTKKPVEPIPPINTINPVEKLQVDINSILQDDLFKSASIGINVISTETDEILYSKNSLRLHHPASTTKLFTAATALIKLGTDFQFETTLYTDTNTETDVRNNIYLKGRGDPVLNIDDIEELAFILVESGVKSILGDIIVDESYFDSVREGPGWMWDDKPFQLSALSIRSIEPEKNMGSRAIACGHILKKKIIEYGIVVSGKVTSGEVPSSAIIISQNLSPPLGQIIRFMNKPSDNWIAEFLFKTIGAEVKGVPGTWRKGREAITEFLNEILTEPPPHRFVDGSGLSRYNLTSSELLTKLLYHMHKQFEIMPEFLSSLPIAGVDGTLRNRMQGMYAEKILRAKTGTLSGVSALAGYTVTADGEVLVFGILISHYLGTSANARGIQDKIGNILTEFSRH